MDESARLASQLVEFTDRHGRKFWLSPKGLHHIGHDNEIKDPLLFVQQALQQTVAIVESNSKPGTWLYYAPMRNGLYYTAVASTQDQRIKTAYVSSRIKKGEIRWQSSRLEI